MALPLLAPVLLPPVLLLAAYYVVLLPWHRARCRRRFGVAPGATTVAFFHPYCNAGGGGERVLWLAIKALAGLHDEEQPTRRKRPLHVLIYAGQEDSASGDGGADILARAQAHFGVDLKAMALPISFVFVRGRPWLEARRYPVFTMLGQSLGSVLLALVCLGHFVPDVFLDTTGCAFTYPVAAVLGRARVAAYVHYPTISTDMLSLVREQRPSYNNDAALAASGWRSRAKLLYYHAFALLYGLCGAFVSLVMVNSSWTRGHIEKLWRLAPKVWTVFPPCDISSFKDFSLTPREPVVLSVGQFRPEKDHPLQIRAFARFLQLAPKGKKPSSPMRTRQQQQQQRDGVRLVLLGSCRGAEDAARVEALRRLVAEEGIEDHVDFVVGASFAELKRWLGRASVGLHTMWNEHFGICIVEYMAAGLIPVAHNSGGPKADIIEPGTSGFLAATADEYAHALAKVFAPGATTEGERTAIRREARARAERFSDEVFLKSFGRLMRGFLT